MVTHGRGCETKSLGDFRVVQPLRNQVEDFAFAVGEFGKDLRGKRWLGRGKIIQHPLGYRRAKERFTVRVVLELRKAEIGSDDHCQTVLLIIDVFDDIAFRARDFVLRFLARTCDELSPRMYIRPLGS